MYSTPIEGTEFCLVEFPGFGHNDEDVFQNISTWLKETYEKGEYLSGLLYFHRIINDCHDGSDLRTLSIIKKLCGKERFRNITVVSTYWDKEHEDVAEAREKAFKESLDVWGDLIHEYASTERLPNERKKCVDFLTKLAKGDTITLDIQVEMVDEDKSANDTKPAAEMKFYKRHQAIRDAEELERATEQHRHQLSLGKLRQKVVAQASEEEKAFRERLETLNAEFEALELPTEKDWAKDPRYVEVLKRRTAIFEQQKLAPIEREKSVGGDRSRLGEEHALRLGNLANSTLRRLVLGHKASLKTQQASLEGYDGPKKSKQALQYISQKFQDPSGQNHEQMFCAHCLDQLSLFDTVWGKS